MDIFVFIDAFVEKGLFYLLWAAFLLFVLSLVNYFHKKRSVTRMMSNPCNHGVFMMVRNGRISIEQKDFGRAKILYNEIQRSYPELTDDAKKYLIKLILGMKLKIDENDFVQLLEEFKQVEVSGNQEKIILLRSELIHVYNQFPRKIRKSFYKRMKGILGPF